jgi:hypothetical protein
MTTTTVSSARIPVNTIVNAFVFFLLTAYSPGMFAQDYDGVIEGTVYGPQGEIVPYLAIQATNSESGDFERAEISEQGRYRISNLPAGPYTLKINTPCCAYLTFESEALQIAMGETRQFEIHLEQGGSFNTIGDDPGVVAAAMRARAEIPDEPPPRAMDGKPDFSGVWLVDIDPFPEAPQALPWAEELFQERVANEGIDHPHLRCLPGDAPIPGAAAPFIAKFVQTPNLVVLLFEDYPGFRQMFVDGREHPDDPNPSWMGHSIGRWDGDTLVVDTVGFNDRGWMNGYPRSEELHIIERYTRSEYGVMNLTVTIEDPKVFTQPWTRNIPLHLAPQEELIEFVCENNKWSGASDDYL